MRVNLPRSSRAPSPLWHRALEKYYDELQNIEDCQTAQTVHSLDELINSLSSVQSISPSGYAGIATLKRLAPRLRFIDDFSAVLALCFGADAALTASVWGSIRIILAHASSTAETLQDVLDMLEELSLTLPRFRAYEHTLPVGRQLQQALVDVYGEIICFYARAICFLRSNPHLVLRKNAWQPFQNDFSRTTKRIKILSSTVEIEADMARMRQNETRYKEVLESLNDMKPGKPGNPERCRFNNISFPPNPKFSGREEILDIVHDALRPEVAASSSKSMALFGMGGAGKTQIALQYAYRNLEAYDIVLWVMADNSIAILRSFREIAEGLGLLAGVNETLESGGGPIWEVKSWLITTKSTCLIIFDNADDLAALKTAWPTNNQTSVLLTTRDFTIATSISARHVRVEALGDHEGSKMLLKAAGLEQQSSPDQQHALMISKAFGGLPLALNQIGSFISQRKLPLQDFLPLYERYASKIDARKAPGSDYEYTLSTVWDISLEKLTSASTHLLGLLSFFDPDEVSEDILLHGSKGLDDEKYMFLFDEFDFGDALEELMRAALVNRSRASNGLSTHRLVQSTVRRRLRKPESSESFDAVVHMLCWGFPDHSSTDIGHQISAWAACEKCLSHVNRLAELAEQAGVTPETQQKYAHLLLRCSWYLYEREMYAIAKRMVNQAIVSFEDTSTLGFASALDLDGLIDLDLAQAARALEPFERALEIRRALLGPDDPFIAYSLNNIALAYTETNELDLAYKAHEEAISLRLAANSDRIGNSYSNMSSLLLRMGRPNDAEEMLSRCPSLKDFSDQTFLETGNPRFSGDMVLLSRIRLAQGRPAEAIRLASKALAFRRKLLGNRLKTCDSQYDVACMLVKDGHESSAIHLLEEIVGICETFVEGEGQQARALYKLSEIYGRRDMPRECTSCKEKAMQTRASVKPELRDAPYEEREFSKLCVWMLW